MLAGGDGSPCGVKQYRANPATLRRGLVLREAWCLPAALASDVLASSVPAKHERNSDVAMPPPDEASASARVVRAVFTLAIACELSTGGQHWLSSSSSSSTNWTPISPYRDNPLLAP